MKDVKVYLEDFEKFLIDEFNNFSYPRFPLRIIIAEDIFIWKKIIQKLKNHTDKIIRISDYCKDKESIPEINDFLKDLRNTMKGNQKILCLIPEEIIDILGTGFLSKLLTLEVDPSRNIRIYLPLWKINEGIRDVLEKHKDIGIRKAYPIKVNSKLIEEKKFLRFYIFRDEEILEVLLNLNKVKEEKIEIIFGFLDYLRFWEDLRFDEKTQVLVFSEILYKEKSEIENGISFIKIHTLKDLVEKILGLTVPLQFREDDKNYWKRLTEEMFSYRNDNFQEFIMRKFNVNRIDRSLLYRWKELDEYERWLLYGCLKGLISERNTYLYKVFELSQDFRDFEEFIWKTVILDENNLRLDLIKERAELIKKMNLSKGQGFYQLLQDKEFLDPLKKIMILSGVNHEEKREIIRNLSLYLQDNKDYQETLQYLEINYPELAYYLSFSEVDKLGEYFNLYIKAKITNSHSLIVELERKAREIDLFSFPPRNERLEKYTCKQIWIDGLGVEWISLIVKLLINRGYSVDYEIVRANMPTTTEFNPIPNSAIKFPDLDEIYHRQDREYPDFLIEEIEKLANLVEEKVIPLIEKYKEIVITSDHGSTRFSGWFDERIIFEEKDVEIYNLGRFVKRKLDDLPEVNEDFYVEKHEDSYYLISRGYKVFKGGKRAKVEIHGGGTPEEVLVPIIYVRSQDLPLSIPKISLLTKEITFLEPLLKIEIIPEAKFAEIILIEHLVRLKGEKISEFIWKFDLTSVKTKLEPEEYRVKILCNLGEKDEVFRIKSGLEEEKLFEEF